MASPTESTTILGPLTTTWTPPPACTIPVAQCSNCTIGYQAQTCYSGAEKQDEPTCWPPQTSGAVTRAPPLMGWGLYSPGLVCPSGYATACSYDGRKQTGNFNFLFRPQASETAIGCCPSYVILITWTIMSIQELFLTGVISQGVYVQYTERRPRANLCGNYDCHGTDSNMRGGNNCPLLIPDSTLRCLYGRNDAGHHRFHGSGTLVSTKLPELRRS